MLQRHQRTLNPVTVSVTSSMLREIISCRLMVLSCTTVIGRVLHSGIADIHTGLISKYNTGRVCLFLRHHLWSNCSARCDITEKMAEARGWQVTKIMSQTYAQLSSKCTAQFTVNIMVIVYARMHNPFSPLQLFILEATCNWKINLPLFDGKPLAANEASAVLRVIHVTFHKTCTLLIWTAPAVYKHSLSAL